MDTRSSEQAHSTRPTSRKTPFRRVISCSIVDSCVSYNYYEAGYFALKNGGTKNLDLITNGSEAPTDDSGLAEGRLIAALFGGKASYKDLLTAAAATDSLRVVDGELDNAFSPAVTKIDVRAK